jgi:hypothetical protein
LILIQIREINKVKGDTCKKKIWAPFTFLGGNHRSTKPEISHFVLNIMDRECSRSKSKKKEGEEKSWGEHDKREACSVMVSMARFQGRDVLICRKMRKKWEGGVERGQGADRGEKAAVVPDGAITVGEEPGGEGDVSILDRSIIDKEVQGLEELRNRARGGEGTW